MIIKSPAFKEGELIPLRFTCDGDDVNPLLELREVPKSAKTLVLIVDDPDATSGNGWDHWLLWNINPKTQYIAEDSVPPGAIEGKTSFGEHHYGGPCPPYGHAPHRYRFTLYALDTVLEIDPLSGKVEIEKAMERHVIETASLTGLYARAQ